MASQPYVAELSAPLFDKLAQVSARGKSGKLDVTAKTSDGRTPTLHVWFENGKIISIESPDWSPPAHQWVKQRLDLKELPADLENVTAGDGTIEARGQHYAHTKGIAGITARDIAIVREEWAIGLLLAALSWQKPTFKQESGGLSKLLGRSKTPENAPVRTFQAKTVADLINSTKKAEQRYRKGWEVICAALAQAERPMAPAAHAAPSLEVVIAGVADFDRDWSLDQLAFERGQTRSTIISEVAAKLGSGVTGTFDMVTATPGLTPESLADPSFCLAPVPAQLPVLRPHDPVLANRKFSGDPSALFDVDVNATFGVGESVIGDTTVSVLDEVNADTLETYSTGFEMGAFALDDAAEGSASELTNLSSLMGGQAQLTRADLRNSSEPAPSIPSVGVFPMATPSDDAIAGDFSAFALDAPTSDLPAALEAAGPEPATSDFPDSLEWLANAAPDSGSDALFGEIDGFTLNETSPVAEAQFPPAVEPLLDGPHVFDPVTQPEVGGDSLESALDALFSPTPDTAPTSFEDVSFEEAPQSGEAFELTEPEPFNFPDESEPAPFDFPPAIPQLDEPSLPQEAQKWPSLDSVADPVPAASPSTSGSASVLERLLGQSFIVNLLQRTLATSVTELEQERAAAHASARLRFEELERADRALAAARASLKQHQEQSRSFAVEAENARSRVALERDRLDSIETAIEESRAQAAFEKSMIEELLSKIAEAETRRHDAELREAEQTAQRDTQIAYINDTILTAAERAAQVRDMFDSRELAEAEAAHQRLTMEHEAAARERSSADAAVEAIADNINKAQEAMAVLKAAS